MMEIGKLIKQKRLSLNLRMEDVAKEAKITRATLFAIEKGNSNCSINSLLTVLNVLHLDLSIEATQKNNCLRERATRINNVKDKKINRFIVMCVEQYATYAQMKSSNAYNKILNSGVIDDLINDYEDLHGMSVTYLNNYIDASIRGTKI